MAKFLTTNMTIFSSSPANCRHVTFLSSPMINRHLHPVMSSLSKDSNCPLSLSYLSPNSQQISTVSHRRSRIHAREGGTNCDKSKDVIDVFKENATKLFGLDLVSKEDCDMAQALDKDVATVEHITKTTEVIESIFNLHQQQFTTDDYDIKLKLIESIYEPFIIPKGLRNEVIEVAKKMATAILRIDSMFITMTTLNPPQKTNTLKETVLRCFKKYFPDGMVAKLRLMNTEELEEFQKLIDSTKSSSYDDRTTKYMELLSNIRHLREYLFPLADLVVLICNDYEQVEKSIIKTSSTIANFAVDKMKKLADASAAYKMIISNEATNIEDMELFLNFASVVSESLVKMNKELLNLHDFYTIMLTYMKEFSS